jgi:hypothetical protein
MDLGCLSGKGGLRGYLDEKGYFESAAQTGR